MWLVLLLFRIIVFLLLWLLCLLVMLPLFIPAQQHSRAAYYCSTQQLPESRNLQQSRAIMIDRESTLDQSHGDLCEDGKLADAAVECLIWQESLGEACASS